VRFDKALENVKAKQLANASHDAQMPELPGNTQDVTARLAAD
jgi:hypothetical protein